MEAGELEVLGYPWLCKQFEVSLGYVRVCLKTKQSIKQTERDVGTVVLHAGSVAPVRAFTFLNP